MPITEVCTNDDIIAALQAHEERIGQIVLEARPKIKQLKTMAAELDKSTLVPMTNTLDRILSSVNLTTSELIDIAGFQKGATKKEIEKSLADVYNLSVVNGKLLVTDNGEVDLEHVKSLHSLVGSFQSIQNLIPEIFPCSDSQDMQADVTFNSRFILISTHVKVSIVQGEGCKADTTTTQEVVLGIDKSLQEVLFDNPELTREDLTLYVFWFGKPKATQQLKERALSLGLTEEEYFDTVLRKSSESFKTKIIENPYLQICELGSVLGDDIDLALTQGFGKNKKAKVKLQATPQDILNQIKASGVLTSQPGRSNKHGLKDYGSPATQLLSVINFEKTFGSQNDGLNPCVDTSEDLSSLFDGLFGAIGAATDAINSLINEAVSAFMWLINKVSSLFSVVDAFLFQLIQCLFPPATPLSIEFGPLAELLDLIQGSIDMFSDFFDALGVVLNIISPLACIKATLADIAARAFPGKVPPELSCVLSLFSLDICLGVSMEIGQMEGDLAFAALASVLNNLRMLLTMILSFSSALPSDFATSSCLPVESAILMVKLGLRAAAVSAGIPL